MIDLTRQPRHDPEIERRFVAEGLWTDDVLGESACLCVTLVPGAALDLDDATFWLAGHGVAKMRSPELLEIGYAMPMTPTRKII